MNQFEETYKEKEDIYFSSKRLEVLSKVPKDTRTLLDVGCGVGDFAHEVKKQLNIEVWGVELFPDSAAKAEKKIDKVFQGKIEDIIDKLPDNYFDCITFNDVLEHLVEPWEVLRRIKSKLSKKGIILASIPNVRYYKNIVHFLFERDWQYISEGILDRTHLRFFTKKSMLRMFDECSYSVELIEGINEWHGRRYYTLNLLFLGTLYDARFMQYVVKVKPKN